MDQMDVIDLPSISDEELDYELDVPATSDAETSIRTGLKDAVVVGASAVEAIAIDAHTSVESTNRKRKNVESVHISEEDDSEANSDVQQSEVDTEHEEIQFVGRLSGRVKRIVDKRSGAESTPLEENLSAERFAQILDGGKPDNRRMVRKEELAALYESLDANPDSLELRFSALFVTGKNLEKMDQFQVSKIFAEFDPQIVRPLSAGAFVVTFADKCDVAQLLLDNSKPLRRVRKPRKPEEGELMDSGEEDEEEGQVKEEGGEDVAVTKEEVKCRKVRSNSDVVELDIEKVKVPAGKWRVVTKHVPDNRLVLVRFATGQELRRTIILAKHQDTSDMDDYRNTKLRPGLNVFDEKGNELDWDYEHDTRFFVTDNDGLFEKQTAETEQTQQGGVKSGQQSVVETNSGVKIRTRGRGAKKFLQALDD